MADRFWESKSLAQMSQSEWESICDGCAKCCLYQLEDTDSKERYVTDVACDLLNEQSCKCRDYENRTQRQAFCLKINRDDLEQSLRFAPSTCAYVLLHQGDSLPPWHHLICDDKERIHQLGQSVKYKFRHHSTIEEEPLENYIVSAAESHAHECNNGSKDD